MQKLKELIQEAEKIIELQEINGSMDKHLLIIKDHLTKARIRVAMREDDIKRRKK